LALSSVGAGRGATTTACDTAVGHDGVIPSESIDPTLHVEVHEVEVSSVTVGVNLIGVGAPLLVSVKGTKVGNHDGDGGVLNSAGSWIDTVSSGGKLVARSASLTTPARTSYIKNCLTTSSCVHVVLPAEGVSVTSSATTCASLAIPITGGGSAR